MRRGVVFPDSKITVVLSACDSLSNRKNCFSRDFFHFFYCLAAFFFLLQLFRPHQEMVLTTPMVLSHLHLSFSRSRNCGCSQVKINFPPRDIFSLAPSFMLKDYFFFPPTTPRKLFRFYSSPRTCGWEHLLVPVLSSQIRFFNLTDKSTLLPLPATHQLQSILFNTILNFPSLCFPTFGCGCQRLSFPSNHRNGPPG